MSINTLNPLQLLTALLPSALYTQQSTLIPSCDLFYSNWHLAQTGRRYNFYQIVSLQQFVTLVKTAFTVRPIKDECVELVSERYGTHLFVYDNHRIFRTPS
ncbi:hypothetical protein TELCIR_01273 [Teladorsagia circumcincta]|uniref:Uncharacterized protein n=1 Tax=Teladorsagia circumcincta TaxID=45464 RepID=A0A2G9V2G5_TELCI|nr:hypothetical protein TELCIR_01273 [Teladorsagia circumcincta]